MAWHGIAAIGMRILHTNTMAQRLPLILTAIQTLLVGFVVEKNFDILRYQ